MNGDKKRSVGAVKWVEVSNKGDRELVGGGSICRYSLKKIGATPSSSYAVVKFSFGSIVVNGAVIDCFCLLRISEAGCLISSTCFWKKLSEYRVGRIRYPV